MRSLARRINAILERLATPAPAQPTPPAERSRLPTILGVFTAAVAVIAVALQVVSFVDEVHDRVPSAEVKSVGLGGRQGPGVPMTADGDGGVSAPSQAKPARSVTATPTLPSTTTSVLHSGGSSGGLVGGTVPTTVPAVLGAPADPDGGAVPETGPGSVVPAADSTAVVGATGDAGLTSGTVAASDDYLVLSLDVVNDSGAPTVIDRIKTGTLAVDSSATAPGDQPSEPPPSCPSSSHGEHRYAIKRVDFDPPANVRGHTVQQGKAVVVNADGDESSGSFSYCGSSSDGAPRFGFSLPVHVPLGAGEARVITIAIPRTVVVPRAGRLAVVRPFEELVTLLSRRAFIFDIYFGGRSSTKTCVLEADLPRCW